MADELRDHKIAILATDGVEQIELEEPREAVQEAGAQAVLLSIDDCHGPWNVAEADVLQGRRITSWPSIRTDLRRAGAEAVDDEVVIDGNLVSSRSPDDLSAFCDAIVRELSSVHAS